MDTESTRRFLFDYYDPDKRIDRLDIGGVWVGRFDLVSLLALRDFFQPQTIIVSGRVFLRSPGFSAEPLEKFVEERAKLDKTSASYQDSVNSYNWVTLIYELGPLFVRDQIDDERLVCAEETIAEIVRDSWHLWLHHVYPDRQFELRVLSPEETGDGWGVGFEECAG
jgi:hypothetical protein